MSRTADQILQQEFLQARAKILELAATFDRIELSQGDVTRSSQMELLKRGIDVLRDSSSGKAQQVQLLFSREYDPNWRKAMGV